MVWRTKEINTVSRTRNVEVSLETKEKVYQPYLLGTLRILFSLYMKNNYFVYIVKVKKLRGSGSTNKI